MSDDPQMSFLGDVPAAPGTEARNAEREKYLALLAEKLKDPEFRKIEGFPIGTDEAILALSDPPYYTACPNPFIEEWLAEHAKPYDAATDDYHREPFATDVSEGKNDPIYNAHSYHTKVPHKAIMRYILHYTQPGDVVYDGFCGTGMTGVAAQMCGDKAQVESLGYRVLPDGTILDNAGAPFSRLGARKAILNDLSPAATFIAYNYNMPVDAEAFEREAKRILAEVEEECGWMYRTLHDATPEETARVAAAIEVCQTADELRNLWRRLEARDQEFYVPGSRMQAGRINYTVWSDVFICPSCGGEIIFWDAAVDKDADKVRDIFSCPHCLAETTKRRCARAQHTFYDDALGKTITQARQVPVLINYSIGKNRYEKRPDTYDNSLIIAINKLPIPHWFPTDRMPDGEESRRNDPAGLTHVHHFYTNRNLLSEAMFLAAARNAGLSELQFLVSALNVHVTKMRRYQPVKPGGTPNLAGTLFVSSLPVELTFFDGMPRKVSDIKNAMRPQNCTNNLVSTGSASETAMARCDYLEYIFTDPPFGGNLMYSELNFLWESWLRVKTNNKREAITNEIQKKGILEYQAIMTSSFKNYYRSLKPGRWMTVEFHNSENAVWNSIHEAILRAGFLIADVRVLNKQQGTFKQVTTSGAVKADLVISCYKPHHAFEERFRALQGKPEGVVEFLQEHLVMLPVAPLSAGGNLEMVAERTRHLLYDRMLAYHLQRGARIPLSASDFYALLDEQFVERDGMYFLPEQASRFDAIKARGVKTEQFSIFVSDEKSAVQWVRARLTEHPQTLGELTPSFMQEMREWDSHEPRPELRDLLREYFIEVGGVWRVADPNNEKDLEQVRRNAHLKLFREYANNTTQLKTFRKEAVLEGFRYCWQTRQYSVITAVCEKMPLKVLQDTHEFVQFYDIAKDLAGTTTGQAAFSWDV